jgi:hypothetical protein
MSWRKTSGNAVFISGSSGGLPPMSNSKWWNQERRERYERILAHSEHLRREFVRDARAALNGEELDRAQQELLSALDRRINPSPYGRPRKEPQLDIYNQADVRHEPMQGHHSHPHAAFGHPVHEDGLHSHDHWHDNDNIHEHGHTGGERPVRAPQTDAAEVSGAYGAELSGKLGPAARAASRRARIENLDRRRGGSA